MRVVVALVNDDEGEDDDGFATAIDHQPDPGMVAPGALRGAPKHTVLMAVRAGVANGNFIVRDFGCCALSRERMAHTLYAVVHHATHFKLQLNNNYCDMTWVL